MTDGHWLKNTGWMNILLKRYVWISRCLKVWTNYFDIAWNFDSTLKSSETQLNGKNQMVLSQTEAINKENGNEQSTQVLQNSWYNQF